MSRHSVFMEHIHLGCRIVTFIAFQWHKGQINVIWPFRLKSHCKILDTYVSDLAPHKKVGRIRKKPDLCCSNCYQIGYRRHMGKKNQTWVTFACSLNVVWVTTNDAEVMIIKLPFWQTFSESLNPCKIISAGMGLSVKTIQKWSVIWSMICLMSLWSRVESWLSSFHSHCHLCV